MSKLGASISCGLGTKVYRRMDCFPCPGFDIRKRFQTDPREIAAVKFMVPDSLGPAPARRRRSLQGRYSSYQSRLEPFRALQAVQSLIIDHQSKLQNGQSHRARELSEAFIKSNPARSVSPVEAKERMRDGKSAPKKHNFGLTGPPVSSLISQRRAPKARRVGAAELVGGRDFNASASA